MKPRVIHIMILDKFTPHYIDFIYKYFDKDVHEFIMIDKQEYKYGLSKNHNVIWINDDISEISKLTHKLREADKIILHGLWREGFIEYLLFKPYLIEKCYWVMWGGDFYYPEIHSRQKKILIKNLKHFVTLVEGDYEYVKKNYEVDGVYHECITYPFIGTIDDKILKYCEEYNKTKINGIKEIYILVGNSATKTNNHIEIFEKLYSCSNEKIKIFVPLTYGDMKYAQEIIEIGRKMFGDKFVPLKEHMPYEDYLKFLVNIDIAIFAHNRQQALGNTIALLGMGKKVYLKSGTSQWVLFNKLGVKVYDFNEGINLDPMNEYESLVNIDKMRSYFSIQNAIKQWTEIFEGDGIK